MTTAAPARAPEMAGGEHELAPAVTLGRDVGEVLRNHLGPARTNRVNLDLRRGDGHHDDCAASEPSCRERHALRVIARGGGDHAACELLGGKLHHLVVGAAQLE